MLVYINLCCGSEAHRRSALRGDQDPVSRSALPLMDEDISLSLSLSIYIYVYMYIYV